MTTRDRASGWGLGLASPHSAPESPPSMRTFPSTDAVFAAYAARRFESLTEYSPEAFERLLRRAFPRASVRPCELAFAQETVWYVYREGRWVPRRTMPWWRNAALPRVVVDADGFIVEANVRPARELHAESLVGRHVLDFAGDASFAELLRTLGSADGPDEWTSTIQYVLGGKLQVAEVHAERAGDGLAAIVVRRAPGPAFVDLRPAAPQPELDCYPPRDRLFAAYARALLDRIVEPLPDGLELRLRRLYPGASVRVAMDGAAQAGVASVWECRRDDRPPLPEGWWREPGLPWVVLDAASRVVSASPDLEASLGEALAGRSWQELTAAGDVPDAVTATAVLFELGETETAYVARSRDGVARAFDAWVTARGDRLTAVLRPR